MNESLRKLIGTWKLISCTFKNEQGEDVDFFGPNPFGILIYDSNKNMSAQFLKSKRDLFANDAFASGADEEIVKAFQSYQAYFGKYELSEDLTVTHFIEGSLFPNWQNHEETRYLTFVDDTKIQLVTPPTMVGNHEMVVTATWIKDA